MGEVTCMFLKVGSIWKSRRLCVVLQLFPLYRRGHRGPGEVGGLLRLSRQASGNPARVCPLNCSAALPVESPPGL